MDSSLPDSSVHGSSQERILEGVAFPSPGDHPDQGLNLSLLPLQVDSLPLCHLVSPYLLQMALFHPFFFFYGWAPLQLLSTNQMIGIMEVIHQLSYVWLFCDPMDCSPPGSSLHGISQSRILECIAMPSSRGSSWPTSQTCISCISCISGRLFTHWTIREAPINGAPFQHADSSVILP